MRLTTPLLCLAMVLASATFAAAKPAFVLTTVNLRAAPGTTNEIIAKIPGGSLVDADNCTAGWCAVTWKEKRGFSIQTSLDLSGRVPSRRPPGPPAYSSARGPAYGPPPGYVVVAPPVYYGPPAPLYYGYGPYRRHRYWWRW